MHCLLDKPDCLCKREGKWQKAPEEYHTRYHSELPKNRVRYIRQNSIGDPMGRAETPKDLELFFNYLND